MLIEMLTKGKKKRSVKFWDTIEEMWTRPRQTLPPASSSAACRQMPT